MTKLADICGKPALMRAQGPARAYIPPSSPSVTNFIKGLGYYALDYTLNIGDRLTRRLLGIDKSNRISSQLQPVYAAAEGFRHPKSEIDINKHEFTRPMLAEKKSSEGAENETIEEKIREYLSLKHAAATPEEIAINYSLGLNTVKNKLNQLVDQRALVKAGKFYHEAWLKERELNEALGGADNRANQSFTDFSNAFEGIQKELCPEKLETPNAVDVATKLATHAQKLFGSKDFKLYPDLEGAPPYLTSIWNGQSEYYDCTIINGEIKASDETDEASKTLAIEIAESKKQFKGLLDKEVERIIFLRARSNEEKTENILAINNPVFPYQIASFSTLQYWLLQINSLIGKTLSRRARQTLEATEANGGGGRTIKVPDRQELTPEQFYKEIVKFGSGKSKKFKNKRDKGKAASSVASIERPALNLPPELLPALDKGLMQTSQLAWKGKTMGPVNGYTQGFIEEHFRKVDRLLAVFHRKSYELIAFAGTKDVELEDTVFTLMEVTMVQDIYQGMGIGSYLNRELVGNKLKENNLQPFYLAFRTANPIVLGGYADVVSEIYPNSLDKDARPSPEFVKIAKAASGRINPGIEINEDTFVVRGVYPQDSGLIYDPANVPAYRKMKVNKYCEERLEYSKREGNAFIVVARIGIDVLDRYDIKIPNFLKRIFLL